MSKVQLNFRVSEEDKATFEQAARDAGKSITTWIVDTLRRAADAVESPDEVLNEPAEQAIVSPGQLDQAAQPLQSSRRVQNVPWSELCSKCQRGVNKPEWCDQCKPLWERHNRQVNVT